MRLIEFLAASLLSTLAAVAFGGGAAIVIAVLALGMKISGALAFYFVVWWIALFILLPVGIRSQNEMGTTVPGTEPGAPVLPRIRERAIMTTVLSNVIFLVSILLMPLAGL